MRDQSRGQLSARLKFLIERWGDFEDPRDCTCGYLRGYLTSAVRGCTELAPISLDPAVTG